MLVEFKDAGGRSFHDAFQRWRRKNPDGFFLAFRASRSAMMHIATGCGHPGNTEWRAEDFGQSLTRKLKVCAATTAELLAYAKANRVSVSTCAHCRPGYVAPEPKRQTKAAAPVNHEQRAAAVWSVLAERARKRNTITYRDLAAEAGGFHHRALGRPLGLVQDYCKDEDERLPPLTSLVVHSGDARPGSGFIAWDADDLETAQGKVFAFDWSSIPNPFGYAESGETEEGLAERLVEEPTSANDVYQLVKVRGKAQSIFRLALLDAYDWACAFCGLTFTEALDAAHIVPWARCSGADRMSVNNGLLLCSNHHEMFDADWIHINEDFKIHYTDMARKHGPYSEMDEAVSTLLHGHAIRLPKSKKLWPNPKHIRARYAK